ncbi:MAG: 5-methyltetrahydrofolate--homocysteine methyltransferase [Prevotellaceae bacterium]|nr:5-methyltetrahydrofolate--homocysteine methyltransferase [Prevotellaceae bacterium]
MKGKDYLKSVIHHYRISDVAPYINWIYFFHAWSFPLKYASIAHIHGCDACRASWLSGFSEAERPRATEAMKLQNDASRMLAKLDAYYEIGAIFRLFNSNADNDDIIVGKTRLPMLRQQTPNSNGHCLCLSDFIRPLETQEYDQIGIFATAVNAKIENLYAEDTYNRMLVQTLADRLAEAAAECLHREVRTEIWGYARDEKLSIDELHLEKFQGIRPAVGYPCLPDLSLNFLLDELLDFSQIGIRLTEHGMMRPHASVSGLMLSHPQSCYFTVGTIDEIQLTDYARRRGMSPTELRTYLIRNLN